MISIVIILFFMNYFISIHGLYLTKPQWNLINNVISNKNININHLEREKVNSILFEAYRCFAFRKMIEFRQTYKYICKDISTDELTMCAYMGLYKAIKNYNGNYCLDNYASIYIKGELFRAITAKNSLSPVPNNILRSNKFYLSYRERNKINHI